RAASGRLGADAGRDRRRSRPWRHRYPAALAALRSEDHPVTVAAEVAPAALAHRGVVGDRRTVEVASASLRHGANRRISGRTCHAETRPRPVLAAVLRASLTARRAARIGHASELTVRRRRCGSVAAGDPDGLPFTVVAAELHTRLTGRRTLRVLRSPVEAVVGRRRTLCTEGKRYPTEDGERAT